MDGLTKLRDVKTSDNKGTLLNVLANVLETRNANALDFFQDMPAVEEARKSIYTLIYERNANIRYYSEYANFKIKNKGPARWFRNIDKRV